ncbi:glycosyl transferase [Caulobacter sp. B11]|uniref:glycosyltransferase n=1 Tax=Caulobacter sp. B11 TaxID=2048899 RepID=UPI000C12DDAC|nr:glycosyltransferase [Caulobacter sp. B11]PHY12804.1 glycosyl transferase [Caulobacter sp. B11]
MNILHIVASIDPASGGPIESVLRQDEACKARGVSVTRELVTLDPPDSHHLQGFPLTVHALGRPRTGSRLPWRRALEHYGYAPNLVPWLRANIGSYDTVIVDGLWNYAPFAASRVLPDGKTPYFVFPHGMMDPWFRRTYPLKHLAKQAFWLFGEGRLLAGARSAFFTCEEERREARGQFFGHPYRETVISFGTSAPPLHTTGQDTAFRAALPALDTRPYLLFLSRIHAKKGCDLLVEAFARVAADHPSVDLVVAGPDQAGLRASLEALAARRGVAARIHWAGPLYGNAKWGALYGADAFILPSHQENFGIAVAEALGCGTPVLISNKVNIWREIDTAGAGLVEPDTADGAETLLRRWFATTQAEKATMREAARSLFKDQFNVANTGPALIRTIEQFL